MSKGQVPFGSLQWTPGASAASTALRALPPPSAAESVRQAGKVDEDMYFIEERLRTYWRANGESFGPGGPVLAGEKSRFARPPANGPKVRATPTVSDLVVQDDLQHPLAEFSISPTGPKSAVIRHAPSGRELRITPRCRRART